MIILSKQLPSIFLSGQLSFQPYKTFWFILWEIKSNLENVFYTNDYCSTDIILQIIKKLFDKKLIDSKVI